MKKAILIIAAVILLGGVIHSSLGLSSLFSGGLTLDRLWFTSAGLALIFIAFLNYLVINTNPQQASFFAIGHISNILASILMGLILLLLPAPHVALLFILLLAETVLLIKAQITAVRSIA